MMRMLILISMLPRSPQGEGWSLAGQSGQQLEVLGLAPPLLSLPLADHHQAHVLQRAGDQQEKLQTGSPVRGGSDRADGLEILRLSPHGGGAGHYQPKHTGAHTSLYLGPLYQILIYNSCANL